MEQKKKEQDVEERIRDLKEEEAKLQDLRRQKREEQRAKKRPAEEMIDEEIAKMIGFGGFGSSKKPHWMFYDKEISFLMHFLYIIEFEARKNMSRVNKYINFIQRRLYLTIIAVNIPFLFPYLF